MHQMRFGDERVVFIITLKVVVAVRAVLACVHVVEEGCVCCVMLGAHVELWALICTRSTNVRSNSLLVSKTCWHLHVGL